MSRKIKVLIVDDSLVFRETLAKGMMTDPSIEVVGKASDPFVARDLIIKHNPDVLTLDIEMPRMNGIEFLRRLMPQHPIPVVLVSAVKMDVFEALNAGAVDFVAKPDFRNSQKISLFINELIIKLKIASTAKVSHWKNATARILDKPSINKEKIIVIGASTGGTEAIDYILKAFPANMPGILVVQHMPAVFTNMYASRLNSICNLEVKEAENGDRVLPGRVLIAPGEYQMRLKKSGANCFVECFVGERVNGHIPSVDVLFNSVADHLGGNAIGVLLTGMGNDGAKGLLKMRQKGARTIGQDQESCIVYGMPKVAWELGAVQRQLHLNEIPRGIFSILSGR